MSDDAEQSAFPVVGLGASAGGITALKAFFGAMPGDSGMAFVVIMHLNPGYTSQLAHVLSGHAAMPVVDAEEGMPVEPNRVHVIPANAKLSVNDGHFRLEEIDRERAARRPVDHFFVSLAANYGDWAIAAVLSGTGSNGSAGIARVKERGGLVVVQDPATADYSGMPSHALGTGLPDIVLPADRLPGALLDYVRNNRNVLDGTPTAPQGEETDHFGRLMSLLHSRTGQEFRCYKDATVMRRIRRRMGLRQKSRLADYVDLVAGDPDELTGLTRDLLITVTSFFRDTEAWETLRTAAIQPLIADYDPQETVRIWAPGCASGEEAYSLAMLLFEEADKAGKALSLTIFATDTAEAALSVGRAGVYPASVVEELSQERIDTFFVREDDTFRVRPKLRDCVTFAPQNLLQDPPFSHIHLISCRNLLIYLKPDFQRKVIALFHFALRRDGILFLGNVETPVGQDGLFDAVSKRWRIYRRRGQTRHDIIDFPVIPRSRDFERHPRNEQPVDKGARRDPTDMARRALLDRYAPPAVVVDPDMRVRYFHGDTGAFLKHPEGEPTYDLLQLLRDGLLMPVRTVLEAARESKRSRSGEAWIQGNDGGNRQTIVTAMPLGGGDGSCLLSFEDPPRQMPSRGEAAKPGEGPDAGGEAGPDAADNRQLEEDLIATREQLRMTVRQLEASNEDLKASNEEIMSMNEELQSANEELESSKEELQSLNEELNTVNSQLQSKVQELENKSNDLKNLLNSTDTPTLFLDERFCIRWFTPTIRELIDLTPADVGREIVHFARKYADGELREAGEAVLRTLVPDSQEVRGDNGRWYVRRLLPYRTEDNRIEGLVATFTDVSERKEFEEEIARARHYAESIVETVRAPLLTLRPDLTIMKANSSFYHMFEVDSRRTENRFLYELGHGQWDIPELRRLLTDILPRDKVVEDYEVDHDFPDIGERVMLLNARRLDHLDLILLSIEDATERRRAEERQKKLIGELNHRIKNMLNTIQAVAWQTMRRTDSLEAFETSFLDRLQALSHCHDVLVRCGWNHADFSQLIEETLGPHLRPGHDELVDECPELTLKPAAAQGLTMVLHELATNAAKYGALSRESGRLSVQCRTLGHQSGTRLALIWDESGGPPARPPEGKGFGLTLIEGTVKSELNGTIRFDYREEGLRVEAEFLLK